MFSTSELENVLFIDIETACMVADYYEMPPRMQTLWDKKSRRYQQQEPEKSSEELFFEKGGIHAEFAKVVCISCGYLKFSTEGKPEIRLKSFAGDNEQELLAEFGEMVQKYTQQKSGRKLCAHNGKEFDFPFLGRRYLIHQLPLPGVLQTQGKKPWETPFLDTMELWKFGDYKSYTSLDLLGAILGVPSSKDDIDGSQVSAVYWHNRNVDRIREYCEKDVVATAQVLLRMSYQPLLEIG
ncbi:MAG: 3'-5' exonuclease [Bacteroidota bacterium]